jgi:lipopolysaccharide/colanic/teichoic acid biosynthesis glycosyltransferase
MQEQATRPAARTPLAPAPAQPIRALRGLAIIAPASHPSGLGAFVKRSIDVVVAALVLLLLAPLTLIVAIAIKLDSPGPVLMGQERVSKGLRPFRMYKFRSMVANASDLVASLAPLNEATPPLFKMQKDPRVTRVGRHLRRLSVDELPQVLNVLRGDMSLVGPRPPFAHEVEYDQRRQKIRLQHRPGMTGLWQVSGRSNLGYEEMIALDLRYMRDWSILLDLSILLRTPAVVLSGRGAR